ncbi:hypothetical protein ACROYT_G009834 [Oculina patagonica]
MQHLRSRNIEPLLIARKALNRRHQRCCVRVCWFVFFFSAFLSPEPQQQARRTLVVSPRKQDHAGPLLLLKFFFWSNEEIDRHKDLKFDDVSDCRNKHTENLN